MMIVMKFGGTSVESAEAIERVAGIVRDRLDRRPVVVVSAMGRTTISCWRSRRRRCGASAKQALESAGSSCASFICANPRGWAWTRKSKRILTSWGNW